MKTRNTAVKQRPAYYRYMFMPVLAGFFVLFAGVLSAAPPELHVVGKYLQTVSGGCTVRLVGVDVDGLEWSPAGYGPPNGNAGNIGQSVTAAINTWHANFVRIPISQDFWFGKTNSHGTANQANYRAFVDSAVTAASNLNCYAEIDLHWSGTGSYGTSNDQQDMPDDNSTALWTDVATHYINNPAVFFDLYNEPKDDSWSTWKNGGTSLGGFHTPGFQALVKTVRDTGAKNIIVIGGLGWAWDMTGISANSITDTNTAGNMSGDGIMYEAHIYDNKGGANEAAKIALWNTNVTVAVNAGFCVDIGEFGPATSGQDSSGCTPFETDLISWMNGNNPANYAYNAMAWDFNTTAGPVILSDWTFNNVTACHGNAVRNWLAAVTPLVCGPGNTPTFTPTRTRTNTPVITPTFTFTRSVTPTYTRTNTPAITPTFTLSGTPTFSRTVTATGTSTRTVTPSFTSSPQNTATCTMTRTVTPANTSTFTPVNTQTFTRTATNTPANTSTNTPVNTATFTRTVTNTPVNTMTNTPVNTATITLTRTNTPVNSPTNTPVNTSTFTQTRTSTPLNTLTNTPVNTQTFTATRTSTAGNTATNTPFNTSTNTPVNTASATASVSPSNTYTRTPTYTVTRTSTPGNTPSATPSVSPQNTNTRTPTNTLINTATNTPVNTVTYTRTRTNTPVNTATSTFTLISTATPTDTDTPDYSPTETWTGTPPSPTITATITGTSTPLNTFTRTATNTSLPTVSFTPTVTRTATLISTGTKTATPSITVTLTATFTATRSVTPTVTGTYTSVSTATFTRTATSLPPPTFTPTAAWDAVFTITNTLVYPNPYAFNYTANDLSVKMTISQPANELTAKIYTSAFRRVLEIPAGKGSTRDLTIIIPRLRLSRLASGTYYLVVSGVSASSGSKAVSKPEALVVLR